VQPPVLMLADGGSTLVTCVQQNLAACAATWLQNTAIRRENARFSDNGSCKYLQKALEPTEFNGLTGVCLVVSMRAVTVQRDVMNRNWNAMTPERRRKEDRKRSVDAN
jgi:hypothetical protein